MNMIIKEKIRTLKEDIKVLELKKNTLKDKVEQQKNFIDEINKLSDESIDGYTRVRLIPTGRSQYRDG